MKQSSKILILMCAYVIISVFMVSCGRYSPASPVEGNGYPHHYPHQGE
ncbi:MAG: hypothetical protein J6039_01880 [Alphaproteobacteria bacterium]|nr:hypothetical protein [Alphaproteobacteria bacterium]